MSEFQRMITSAQTTLIHVMDLKKNDSVLVITDEITKNEGEAFYKAAVEYGCKAKMYSLPEKKRPLIDVPKQMKKLAEGKTIIINAFKGLADETPFRIKWVKSMLATDSIRVGHGAGITKSMMIDGPMNIDYEKMTDTAYKLIKKFDEAKLVHITAPGGTDIIINIEDRAFSTDVKINKKPYMVNLPCGEIWCGPKESEGDGIIVCDGSIGDIGKVKKPLKISIKDGKISKLESEDLKLVENVEKLLSIDEEARIIGELGIGLNSGAKLSGILLEDEKALQTGHIAFGNNTDMDGGQNKSKTHRDFLFYKPTMKVTFKDGSSKVVIKDGEFNL